MEDILQLFSLNRGKNRLRGHLAKYTKAQSSIVLHSFQQRDRMVATSIINAGSWKLMRFALCISMALCFFISACTGLNQSSRPYDHRKCMDTIPTSVKGLEIASGLRTRQSIIQDMVPVTCYGHVMYEKMRAKGESINPGTVVVKVTVEYTGEVYRVEVEDATIQSEKFLKNIVDLIMDTDFVGWQRSDIDTVFIYPMVFGVY
jgi:hypothetical protein